MTEILTRGEVLKGEERGIKLEREDDLFEKGHWDEGKVLLESWVEYGCKNGGAEAEMSWLDVLKKVRGSKRVKL